MERTREDFEKYITEREVSLRKAVSKVKSKHEILDEEDSDALLPYVKEFREKTK